MAIRVMTPRGVVETEPGPFQDKIRDVARGAGLTKFRVFVGGVEVASPAQAPANLEEGQEVVLFPYDQAG